MPACMHTSLEVLIYVQTLGQPGIKVIFYAETLIIITCDYYTVFHHM